MSLELSMTELELAMRKLANTVKLDTIEACAKIAENGCLVPPDGGSPTEDERLMCEDIARSIRALATRSPQATVQPEDGK